MSIFNDTYENLILKPLSGSGSVGSEISFSGSVFKGTRVDTLKQMLAIYLRKELRQMVVPSDIMLMAFGDELADGNTTLEDYGIDDQTPITYILQTSAAGLKPLSGRAPATKSKSRTLFLTPRADQSPPPPYSAKTDSAPAAPTGPMLKTVFIQDDHRTYALHDVSLSMTFTDFAKRLEREKGVPVEFTKYVFGGKQLIPGNEKTLMDYNLQNDSTIILVLRLPGGLTIQ